MIARAVALALLFPSIALAQAGFFIPGENVCTAITFDCTSDDECETRFMTGSHCQLLTFEGAEPFQACVPDGAAFCCLTDANLQCPDGGICHLATADQAGVCLRAENDYCDPDPAAPQIEQCHTAPDGSFPVGYDSGDCDADSVPNAAELEAGTAICAAPPDRLAVWVDTGRDIDCLTEVTPCFPEGTTCDASFDGTCQHDERTGDASPLCAPSPDVFCCGGDNDAVCPALTCVFASDRPGAPGVCTNDAFVCSDDEATLRACHTSTEGAIPVPIEIGDCDADGIENARDPDPCTANADVDAGTTEPPPRFSPQFTGGGGCVCRAGGPRSGTGAISVLIALAMILRRRALRNS